MLTQTQGEHHSLTRLARAHGEHHLCPPGSPFKAALARPFIAKTARRPTTTFHFQNYPELPQKQVRPPLTMSPISLSEIVSALPADEHWGPPTSTETMLDGVPYAPYSKGDKLGRMADWTSEGKDGRDGRGGRQQYNRSYRGS
jgi:Eukaryotic translation initiation factor 3 subunit 7 (eIF-3)